MENEEILRPLSNRPPRHCPVCGARVAEGAKTCLMCGASLEDVAAESIAPEAPAKHLSVVRIVVLAIVAMVILVGAVMLGLNLSQGDLATELPTFTPTVTPTPTTTLVPTATPSPTLTPTPMPTPTSLPPRAYAVQSGDSLLSIALDFDLTVDQLMAFNGLNSETIIAGQELLIPPPTPTPGPTPTPNSVDSTAMPYTLYTVQQGDVLSIIAQQFGVSVDDIRRANDMGADDETINVGQVLTIPQYTPTPPPFSDVVVSGTATPRGAYPAPMMLYPPHDVVFAGEDALIVLQWASVGLLDEREMYQVELIIPTPAGKNTIYTYLRSTAWRVPADLWPAENVADRQCSWRVNVARRVTESGEPNYKIISRMERRRVFNWTVAQP